MDILQVGSSLLCKTYCRFRRGTDAAYKLANMFNRDQYARTGRDQTGVIEEDIHGAIKDTIAKYTRQMEDIMSGLSDKQLRAMSNIMRGQYRNKQTGAIQIPSLGISVEQS